MNRKETTLILLIFLAVCGKTFGYNYFNQMEEDFCHKGVCYKILNGKEVEVIGHNFRLIEWILVGDENLSDTKGHEYDTLPSGRLVIPPALRYRGVTYRVVSIAKEAFRDCIDLVSVVIPNSVTRIGESAFYCCYAMTDVVIPCGLTSIENGVFNECTSLKSAVIPNSVTRIGNYAFANCENLRNVTIPNSVKSIGSHAFYLCRRLTSVTIPNSVTSLGRGSFRECYAMKSITIPGSVTSIGKQAFWGCRTLSRINVPKGSKEKFKSMLPEKLWNMIYE